MHNIKEIKNNIETFEKKLKSRNSNINLKDILKLDKLNREIIQIKEKGSCAKAAKAGLSASFFQFSEF